MTTRCGQFQSLLLAIVLAIGAGAIWYLAVAILWSTVEGIFPPHREKGEHLFILKDGTPIIQSWRDGYNGYYTLDGKEVKNPQIHSAPPINAPVRSDDRFTKLTWPQRLRTLCRGSGKSTSNWYFIHNGELHGRGYFVAFNAETNREVGYIGRNGFRHDMLPREEQFPVDGKRMKRYWEYYGIPVEQFILLFLADDGLIRVNLDEQTTKFLWKDSDLVSVSMTPKNPTALGEESTRSAHPLVILLRKPDRVLVLDIEGKELESYIIPTELRNVDLEWLRLPDGQSLVRKDNGNELYWLDTTGKIVRHEEVNLQHERVERPWPSAIAHLAMVLVVPSPGAIALTLVCDPWDIWINSHRTKAMGYSVALRQVFCDLWLLLLINGVLSLVLAVLCYLRQRKYGLAGTWMWTLFVLLFGLPAYFGYLAHRAWPARQPCPSCGRRVPRDRPACFACGQDFPAPALKGIEVFA